jgi:hypothetical protein
VGPYRSVVTLAVVLALAGAACTGHKKTAPPANGAPTATALGAVAKVALVTRGTDCGTRALDSGYPTTAVALPTTCLRDADRVGNRAFMIYTGRTGSGGAYRVVFTVDGRGNLRVHAVLAGPTGTVHREGWACPVPDAPLSAGVLLGYPNRVVPVSVDGNKSCRHLLND